MRKLFFLLIVICGVALTGCAQLIAVNDQESDVLAEYMAGTILRYDNNYDEALIYPEETTETSETTETAEIAVTAEIAEANNEDTIDDTSANVPDINNPVETVQNDNIISLASMFKDILKGKFVIKYVDYKLYDSYPDENDFFTLEAGKDKKLLAITFNVKNTTKKTQSLDLKDANLIYQLTDKEGILYNPMMTLLDNDIQFINLEIAAGKTQKAEILFNIAKGIDTSNMKLNITYEDKTTVLDLNQ